MKEKEIIVESPNMKKVFGFYLLWFRIAGVPLQSHKNSILYRIYSTIILANAYSVIATMTLDMCMHIDDMERIMENSRVIVPASSSLWVHMILRSIQEFAEKAMKQAANFSWDEPRTETSNHDDFKMTKLLPAVKPATVKILVISLGYHTCYLILRVMMRDDRPLAINAYYGIDSTISPIYELTNFSQFLMTAVCFPLFFGTTSLYVFLVITACSQFERLKVNLLSIGSEFVITEQNSNEEAEQQKMFCEMQKKLNGCIHHHQKILEFLQSLEEFGSPILVCQFLLILGGMCFAAFSFVMSFGNTLNMAQSFVVYASFLVQLYAYCWFGNELTDLAQSVRDAAWQCNWVGTPVSYQRSLAFIIAMASKEVVLTAGKFVPVTRKTMLNVINQTFSYVMFLVQVKDEGENM